MKKIICLILSLMLLFALTGCGQEPQKTQPSTTEALPTESQPQWITFPADRALTAKQYFVYDCENSTFLTISGQESEKIYPASITKLFTAYVALQYLHADKTIKADQALDMVHAGSSVAELKKGDQLTVRQLIEALLPVPMLKAEALPSTAKVSITSKEEYDLLHVKVTYPEHRNFRAIIEEHNVLESGKTVRIRGTYRTALTLPDHTPLTVAYEDGYTAITLPRIVGYQMIQLSK